MEASLKDGFNVPKLKDNASNWVEYKDRVLTYLGSWGLKGFVKGTISYIPKPFRMNANNVIVNNKGDPASVLERKEQDEEVTEYE